MFDVTFCSTEPDQSRIVNVEKTVSFTHIICYTLNYLCHTQCVWGPAGWGHSQKSPFMREPRQETNIHVSSLSCTTTTYTDAACLVQCATIWVGSRCAFQPSILTL